MHSTAHISSRFRLLAPRFREELESAIGVAAKAHGMSMVCLVSCRRPVSMQDIMAKAEGWAVDFKFSYVTC